MARIEVGVDVEYKEHLRIGGVWYTLEEVKELLTTLHAAMKPRDWLKEGWPDLDVPPQRYELITAKVEGMEVARQHVLKMTVPPEGYTAESAPEGWKYLANAGSKVAKRIYRDMEEAGRNV